MKKFLAVAALVVMGGLGMTQLAQADSANGCCAPKAACCVPGAACCAK